MSQVVNKYGQWKEVINRSCEDDLPSGAGKLCDERRSGNAQNDRAEGKGSEVYTRLHG